MPNLCDRPMSTGMQQQAQPESGTNLSLPENLKAGRMGSAAV